MAVIPKNGDNDVKAGVVKETVELNREFTPSITFQVLADILGRTDETGCCCCNFLDEDALSVITVRLIEVPAPSRSLLSESQIKHEWQRELTVEEASDL